MKAGLVAAWALLGALIACGNGSASHGPPPQATSTTVSPGPSSTVPPGEPWKAATPPSALATPDSSFQNPQPSFVLAVQVSKDGHTLAVWFTGGDPSCGGLQAVRVNEQASSVTVTIFEGLRPLKPGTACTAIGIIQATEVRLGAPLGARRLVDGSSGNDVAVVVHGSW